MDIEAIYKTYAADVYRFVLRLCHNPDLADDLVQIAFLKALTHFEQYEEKGHMYTWLCQIAKNEYFNYLKKKDSKTEPLDETVAESIQDTGSDVEGQIAQADYARRIRQIVHTIPEPYKEVFLLRVYGELSFRDIAELFGKSEVWGRVTFLRAREQIAGRLQDEM